MPLPRMRILKDAYEELKKLDPDTSITTYFIRNLALEGKVKSVMAGRKRLINFDDLLQYLDDQRDCCAEQPEQLENQIRRIG